MDGGDTPAVTFDDVLAAAGRLDGVAVRTPALRSDVLGPDVVVKAECLQRTGSFKFRGAWNRISQLPEGTRVVAASSGNHAQAVALAARLRGGSATIVMPHDAPAGKRAGTEALGAAVVGYDRYAEDRMAIALALAEEQGAVLVPPFDDPHVIAGQGTAGLELLEDAPDVEVLLAPASGGGLLAGCAVAAPGVQCVAVEPEAGDDLRRSLEAGERVRIDVPRTIADALTVDQPGALTFPLLRACGAQAVTVTDEELVEAMRVAADALHLVLEPGGAAALAVALRGDFAGARVGVVASGGNVGADRFAELLRG